MRTAAGEITSALVTGASSGIGAATVRALRAEGLTVWAMARRADRLAGLAEETGCVPLTADLCDSAAVRAALAGVAPDVLVNNAGLGAGMTGLATASAEDVERTLGTNVTALVQLTRLVLPAMIARGGGHVINLGSTASLYPISSSVYGASKGAVHMFGQNLRIELRGTGVRVTEICPGRVTTEFFDVAVPDAAAAGLPKTLPIRALDAADVADAIMFALSAPAHVNVSMIELVPTEQYFGGASFDRVAYHDAGAPGAVPR